ncbi:iron(III) ABC transporter ATP-binding protein [Echinicola pacifica]|uniref:Iron(III) ABC transporter ATP-binding protein n=1 Tax=Echinicola pacifica TaxID=346377 RepID=A0A918UW33_9BACT|nr:ABC transporter ATP-binding protein [Echinicola pacifica]GGZ39729.1 iron(III) ABC transporter ATP-binding protein [Echinicola pacifica]
MEKPLYTISAQDLCIGYTRKKQEIKVHDGLNFQLLPGQLYCLLGPNGVGKSTLIKTLLGHIPALSGSIYINGKDLKKLSAEQMAKTASVVLTDRVSSGNLHVADLVALGRVPFTNWAGRLAEADLHIIAKAMEATKINYFKDKPLSEISDGQRQKAMIARALAQDGQLIILDEPTAHLDLINRHEIMQLLRTICKTENKSILVITHDLEVAIETADELWLMQCGEPLIQGSPEDLIVSGKIQHLLTSPGLYFDIHHGRVRSTYPDTVTTIHGPAALCQWFLAALYKAGLQHLGSDYEIHLFEEPFKVMVKTPTGGFEGETIRAAVDFLLMAEDERLK